MLQRFSLNLGLIIIGIVLIAIAFINISFLPSRVERDLSSFFGTLGAVDVETANTYRRIYVDRCLLQSVYVFLTGIVLLAAGLFKAGNRRV
jgi:hypothetical protein